MNIGAERDIKEEQNLASSAPKRPTSTNMVRMFS